MKTPEDRIKHTERALRELEVSNAPAHLLDATKVWLYSLREQLATPKDIDLFWTPRDDDSPIVADRPALNHRCVALGRIYKLLPTHRDALADITGTKGLGSEIVVQDFDAYPDSADKHREDGVWRTAKLYFPASKRKVLLRVHWATFADISRRKQAYIELATPEQDTPGTVSKASQRSATKARAESKTKKLLAEYGL